MQLFHVNHYTHIEAREAGNGRVVYDAKCSGCDWRSHSHLTKRSGWDSGHSHEIASQGVKPRNPFR